jgi:benzaldehyde dehydrogenase (NAD)
MSGVLQQTEWEGRIYSGGFIEGSGGRLEVSDKATDEVLAEVGAASPADVRSAVDFARAVQPEWALTPGKERAGVLRRAAALLSERAEEMTSWIVRESGSIGPKAGWELDYAIQRLHASTGLCLQPYGELVAPAERGQTSIAQRLPVGVVGQITPWNAPLALALRALAPALALGNAVVLKPDPQTPICGGLLLASILEQAGLPDGLVHVLPGGAETGEAIVTDPLVAMVTFTGSSRVGRRVGQLAGGALKKVSLELGGNNAIIVLDDADVEAASSAGSFGSFFHQGQICMTAGRHLVHETVADDYREALARRARALPVGNPHTDAVAIGPMINDRQLERVERIVAETTAAGARILAGGTRDGRYYPATVLDAVAPDTPAFTEEIFGPVAPITTFAGDEEAIELANRTEYGLVAAIQTANPARGLALARRLHTGMIHINDQTIADEPNAPLGGVGISGNGGRFGSMAEWDEFTQWQWVTIRDTPKTYPF